MSNKSRLVIGCRRCKEGYEVANYFADIPQHLNLTTSFHQEDINALFFENYSCPFCHNTLYITPPIIEFVSVFENKNFHVKFEEYYIRIINEQHYIGLPKDKAPEDIYIDLMNSGIDIEEDITLPNTREVQYLQDVAHEYDRNQWVLEFESGNTEHSIDELTKNRYK
ncbi:hypothetical protein H0266_18540 [Halobacillus locisalis]|uniref:CpXC domain-containing protein n=1 Tax=Halobacillus locisalis TaxID=220753 RepID=A0A838CXK9_9BACI|nr:hypothetical protein [Halobacillus locisalis]MBA2176882.1 hypothetical protein [Halobacillus locisalis]